MKKALIIGLPNVGKSTIFRRLIPHKAKIRIVPDSTVEVHRGILDIEGQSFEIIDVPGITNLFFNNDNEQVARNLLIDEVPDLVIQVADAKNLKRSLMLTSLLAEFNIPLMLVLNMVDEASQKGIKVKRHKLEEMLGTAVIETIASEGVGTAAVSSALVRATKPSCSSKLPEAIADYVRCLAGLMPDKAFPEWKQRALALFSLADDPSTVRWAQQRSTINDNQVARQIKEDACRSFPQPLELIVSRANDLRAEAWCEESVQWTPVTSTRYLDRIGDLALTPVTGLLILFILLAALYFTVGKFAAGFLVDLLVVDFFGGVVGPRLNNAVALIPTAWVREIIAGEYGLYGMALVPLFGLVLPVIVFFFFTFGLIEDSGYVSRLSILLDRTFRKIGLNGKAVLPMVLGFSCITMATISTRILDSKRERFIAIFLLSLGIPCSAKLSLILVVLAQVSFAAFLAVFGVVFVMTVISGIILHKLMPVEASPFHFIIEIPPIRIPSLRNAITRTSYRSLMFLREASPLFIIGALGFFLMERIGLLASVEKVAEPIVRGWWGLPPQFAESLIMGFIRGEAGIAVLKKLVDAGIMDHLQLVVAMIVTILFIPCVTNFMVITKEQGSKRAFSIIALVTACATATGGIMNLFFRWMKFTF